MATAMATQVARRLVTGGDPDLLYRVPLLLDGVEYADAPDLADIGHALIEDCLELGWLGQCKVLYLWRANGGKTHGSARLGKCAKATGVLGYVTSADYIIWLAADHLRGQTGLLPFTAWQVEAQLYHELSHAAVDDDDRQMIVLHDFEGFLAELRRYGAWRPSLEDLVAAFGQLRLPIAAS